MLSRRTLWTSVALVIALGTCSWACNIPVFRYALERWPADPLRLLVFHTKPLTGEQQQFMEALAGREAAAGGHANLRIKLLNPLETLEADEARHWQALQASSDKRSDLSMPQAILCGQHGRGEFQYWSGELEKLASAINGSPVLDELERRLLAGHSVVWLVVQAKHKEQTQKTLDLLAAEHRRLENELELPEGIGLPGSELFSEVPLFLRFSTLELERDAAQEQLLLSLVKALQPEAYAEGEAIVLPVFGRGRVLEVIPAGVLSDRLIEDITGFLCGACSCQVKEQNPGFDLFMDVDWDRGLFGESGDRPPASAEGLGQEKNRAPVLLTIPPGSKQ